jgi:hypothetical protein
MSRIRLLHSITSSGFLAFCLLGVGADMGVGVGAVGNEAPAAAEAASNALVEDPEPFVSQPGRFRFRFPGKPQLAEQTSNTPSGPLVMHNVLYEAPEGTVYAISYADLSAASVRAAGPDALLEGGVNGLATSGGWTVVSKKAIKLGPHPGRDVIGDVKVPGAREPGYGRTRLFLVGNRIYQIILIGSKSKVTPADFEKHLDSFELLPEAPAVARTTPARPATATGDTEPFVSQPGRYRIRFPGKPQLAEQRTDTPSGPLIIRTATYESPEGTAYTASYFDLSAASVRAAGPDALLDGGVQGTVASGGWTVTSKEAIKLGQYPGRDVIGDVKVPGAREPGYGRTRLFLVGNRFYQVVLIGSKSKVTPADFEKCLDSFELLPEAPAVARTTPARPAPRTPAAPSDRRQRQPMTKRAPRADAPVANRSRPRNAEPAAPAIDESPGPDPSKPAEVAIELNPAPARLVELPREAARRRGRGEDFREAAPKGGLLVGVRIGYANVLGGSKIGSIQPIFQAGGSYVEGTRKGAPAAGETTVVARPGYAVGGINVRSGLLVDAVQVVFMKYEDGRLDPSETYASAWLGDPRGGSPKSISGDGKIVVGIHGVTDQRAVNSLGLVVAE